MPPFSDEGGRVRDTGSLIHTLFHVYALFHTRLHSVSWCAMLCAHKEKGQTTNPKEDTRYDDMSMKEPTTSRKRGRPGGKKKVIDVAPAEMESAEIIPELHDEFSPIDIEDDVKIVIQERDEVIEKVLAGLDTRLVEGGMGMPLGELRALKKQIDEKSAEKKSDDITAEPTAQIIPEKKEIAEGWVKVGDKGNGKVVVSSVPTLENVPVSVIGARAMKEMVMDGVGVELAGCRALPDKLHERFANEFVLNGQDCEKAVAKVWGAQVKQKKRQGYGQDLLKRYDVGSRIRYIRDEKMAQESGYGMVATKGIMLKELAEMIKGDQLKAADKLKAIEMIARYVGHDKPKGAGGTGGGGQVIKVVTGVRGDPDTGAVVGDGEKEDLLAPDEDDDFDDDDKE